MTKRGIPPKVHKEVEERSEKLCEFRDEMGNRCGRYDRWRGAPHHKAFRSQGGPHTAANTEWLCGYHHSMKHGIKEV